MLEPLLRGYCGLAQPSAKSKLLVGGLHWTAWDFIGLWSITLLLELLFIVFLFLEGAWFDTFNFPPPRLSAVVPFVPLDI